MKNLHSEIGFYIGDICYVLTDDIYDGIWGAHNYQDGDYEVGDGLGFSVYGTAYGDGCYLDDYGCSYCVDAGVIGLVPLELVKKCTWEEASRLGRVIKDAHTASIYAEDGDFGVTILKPKGGSDRLDIDIDTRREEDDDDEEDDWD